MENKQNHIFFSEIKLQTTTKTTATMRLAALKKLHNIRRKKKEQNF